MNTATSPEARVNLPSRLIEFLGPALPFLFLASFFFGGSFWRGEQFVFRDAAHFYYPLFHEVARQWKSGEIPLWSPWDGIGMPLASDATSSVFYPGKLLLLAPWGFDHGMRLYVVIHYLIAYAGTYWAARRGRCSRPSASLAAVAFAFGAPLLSYHANMVFLVGAAWLPWALERGWALIRMPRLAPGIGLAVSLAMMVLGGDPQLVYHTVLLLGIAALFLALPWRRGQWQVGLRTRLGRLGLLTGSAAFAGVLAAVQILPTSHWAARSERATSERPRNIYELGGKLTTKPQGAVDWSALAGRPPRGSHLRHGYDFSIAPWNWPETFLANFNGRIYPRNQRWASAIPAEGRIWFPSLFMGTFAVTLALVPFLRRRSRRLDRWWTLLLVTGTLTSLGWFGLGWIALEIGHASGWYTAEEMPVGAPFGGLYWLLTVLLPGYASFRYPGKWWIVGALGLALLAARGLDLLASHRLPWLAWTVRLAAILGVGGVALYFAAGWLAGLLPQTALDPLFGPLEAAAGLETAAGGLVQASIVLAVVWVILRGRNQTRSAWLIVAVTAADLAIANGWLVATAPQEVWQGDVITHELPEGPPLASVLGIYRGRGVDFYPPSFRKEGSSARQVEGLVIDRQTLFPRYHLLEPVRSVPSIVSIMPVDYQSLWEAADRPEYLKQLLDLLGAQQHWSRNDTGELQTIDRPDAWPAAWWQAKVVELPDESLPQVETWHSAASDLLQRMHESQGTERVVVLYEKLAETPPISGRLAIRPTIDYTRESAGQIIVTLQNSQPGWLVVREYFDSGWQCRVFSADDSASRHQKIYRANQVLMAIPLSAEDVRIELTYWPQEFQWGAAISAAGWLILAGSLIVVSRTAWKRARSGN